jgi:hypothetical protein
MNIESLESRKQNSVDVSATHATKRGEQRCSERRPRDGSE